MTPLPAYHPRGLTPSQSAHSLVQQKRSFRSDLNRIGRPPSRNTSFSAQRTQPQHWQTFQDCPVPPLEYRSTNAIGPTVHEDDEMSIQAARGRAYENLGGEHDNSNGLVSGSSSYRPSHRSFEEPRPDDDRNHRFETQPHDRTTSFMQLDDEDISDMKLKSSEAPAPPQDHSAAKEMVKDMSVPDAMTGAATAQPTIEQKPQAEKQPHPRIDYLAGLVAVSCIMVTLRHFSLTFWPYVTESQGDSMHFHADKWLSAIVGPYLLTPLWIGPFFVTSCRFLSQRYLKTGKLNDIANKMLLRAPRMLIPVIIFMTLEYFLISLGLTHRLEWLPSVTFSTWPYVVPQPNFGIFLNEVIEISYFIPNGAPEIINHYCVGVLWTIPVQLQYSFVVLLATVMIKDVRAPWKRMLFYTLSIVAGWYATSWSACHWLGLLLADADITFNWVKWTQARWWAHYPILTLSFSIAAATPLVLLFNSSIYHWSFMAWEAAIQPDDATGRPIIETIPNIWYAYPAYYQPNLAILTFSVGIQVCVELSTWTQRVLSTKLITFFHPHIMTIYLMHGFVFWSLGSFTAVALGQMGMPYWVILLITGLVCYSVILFFTLITSPLIDFATKGSVKNIWRWATEKPVPHRATTAPFPKELVLDRLEPDSKASEAA